MERPEVYCVVKKSQNWVGVGWILSVAIGLGSVLFVGTYGRVLTPDITAIEH